MAISYDEALGTLQAMFPEWDRHTIAAVLDSNGRHMEHTIEAILAMGGGAGAGAPAAPGSHSSVNGTGTTMRTAGPAMGASAAAAAAAAPAPTRDSKYRGTRVNLPDNFLRVPGYRAANSYTIGDEQLAMMLQNEMFRQEVQQELGMGFMWPGGSQRTPSQRRGQQQQQQQQQQQEESSVMKTISEMGDAMRRKMNELALRFRQRERLEDEGASRPLNRPSDEDDDAEVITFDQNVQRRHRLNDDIGEYEYASNPVAGNKKDR